MEFTSKICLIKEVSIGKDKYLVLVIGEGSGVAILDLKVRIRVNNYIID